MARARRRQDGTSKAIRQREQVRQLRGRRQPPDISYVFTDADFVGQTISGTYYGWKPDDVGTMKLTRYGNVLVLRGRFQRLWTADGSTPVGYTPAINSIIKGRYNTGGTGSVSNIPDDMQAPTGESFYSTIRMRQDISNYDEPRPGYEAHLNFAQGGLPLEIDYSHVDPLTTTVAKIPTRRTVYLSINAVVPYFIPS